METQWISVSSGTLPKYMDDVLVIVNLEGVGQPPKLDVKLGVRTKTDIDGEHWEEYGTGNEIDVTHWQPKPNAIN